MIAPDFGPKVQLEDRKVPTTPIAWAWTKTVAASWRLALLRTIASTPLPTVAASDALHAPGLGAAVEGRPQAASGRCAR
jgi:hypothetical protein